MESEKIDENLLCDFDTGIKDIVIFVMKKNK